jgi:hypothetical protein
MTVETILSILAIVGEVVLRLRRDGGKEEDDAAREALERRIRELEGNQPIVESTPCGRFVVRLDRWGGGVRVDPVANPKGGTADKAEPPRD